MTTGPAADALREALRPSPPGMYQQEAPELQAQLVAVKALADEAGEQIRSQREAGDYNQDRCGQIHGSVSWGISPRIARYSRTRAGLVRSASLTLYGVVAMFLYVVLTSVTW